MTTVTTYQLPKNDVFQGKHASEANWEIANSGLAILTESGSRLFGVDMGGDDNDLLGVCVEPAYVMLGTQSFDEYHYRSVPEGVRTPAGGSELNVYGLQKWTHEVMKGNLNYLLPLFAPDDKTPHLSWVGEEMRAHRSMFLAKSQHKSFLGYLSNQKERMNATNRPELVEQFGYDTKNAYHAVRIARQALQILRIGHVVLPMSTDDRGLLVAIRKGYYTQPDMLRMIGKLEAEILEAYKYSSKLSEKIDNVMIDAWLMSTYLRWWDEHK
jgi:uncharacterized protein